LFDVLPQSDRKRIEARHPAADVCANLFDDKGRSIAGEFTARTIGITREELEKVPMSIVITAGAEKTNALHAVLKAGFIKAIVTDANTAAGLLA
jgi:DNA-binding transcriptional regulator LsrR (DeoR family)